ncbi:MAG: 1-acyl-sn-glycerol-3-phosphate acyltransferase, partial [Myxococcota bacterium]|nr:1-acyl-sn-glycerol-3-phosphate acyltransferase [Myxococcota bacterium]
MNARRELRRATRIAGFGALTAAMLGAFLAHDRLSAGRDRPGIQEPWVKAWAGALLRIFGIRVLASSGELPRDRGHLVVANHRSTADIPILLRAFGGHMVSRADLASWPLLGSAGRAVGTVFVDRSDAVSGAGAVRVIRTLLEKCRTVVVFPEGTTFPDDEVRPFHTGAFVAALHSGADIVPVGLAYASGSGAAFVDESFSTHLARVAAAAPSRVAMCAGEPIAVGEKVRAAQLRDRAHGEV